MNEAYKIHGLSEIDRTQLLKLFFHEYTQSVTNGKNSA